jgi:hypothetical protein
VLAEQVKDAHKEADTEAALEKWQDVFGGEFPASESKGQELSSQALVVASERFALGDISHRQPPPWEERVSFKAHLDGYLFDRSGNKRFRGLSSGVKIPSGLALKFVCSTNTPHPYSIKWQVVNTGPHATEQRGLRGEFFDAKDLMNRKMRTEHVNWEISEFTGSHWIEAFIVKNGGLLARTGRFVINIKNPQH